METNLAIADQRWQPYHPAQIATPALFSQIELTRPVEPIMLSPEYRAARFLVRLHGCPVGYVDLEANPAQLIDRDRIIAALDPATLERIKRHLAVDGHKAGPGHAQTAARLGEELMAVSDSSLCVHLQSSNYTPQVTVAICTRDRAELLPATLDSLLRQTYPHFDVLVVDNAPSSDATEQLVRLRYPTMQYVRESLPGLDHARNRAVKEAQGELLAYIDDDAVADPLWLQALVCAFDAPETMCVTGLVAPMELSTAAQELFERRGYSKSFERQHYTLKNPPPNSAFPYKGYLGTGCNSAFRTAVFGRVGLFDPRLDMGTPVPGGGDHDMFARIIKAGYSLVYDPNPVVFHAHIADMAVLHKKLAQYEYAFLAYLTKHILSDGRAAARLLPHLSWWALRRTAKGLGSALLRRDRPIALAVSPLASLYRGPLAFWRAHQQVRQQRVSGSSNDQEAYLSAAMRAKGSEHAMPRQ